MSDVVIVVAEIIVGIAFLTVVGGLVAVLVSRLQVKPSPADVLEERYARGELTHDQFEQSRRDLAFHGTFGEIIQAQGDNGHEPEPVLSFDKRK